MPTIPGSLDADREYIAQLLDEHNDPSMTFANARDERKQKNVWNGWPTGLPFVSAEWVTDPWGLFNLGRRTADRVRRAPRRKLLPADVRQMLGLPDRDIDLGVIDITWVLPATPGQELRVRPRSLVGVIPPDWRWVNSKVAPTPRQLGALTVTVGCAHSRKVETRLGNCYYETVCPDCGWTYRTDSSD